MSPASIAGSDWRVAELDHLFVLCPASADLAAQALRRAGLQEGSPNDHPGQGTACRRFFLENAYIELLWVRDPQEAQSESTRPTRLWDRWSRLTRGACPFGIVLRPGDDAGEAGSPFPSWPYRPRYLPADMSIDFATGTSLEEPELIYLGFQRGGRARRSVQPTTHSLVSLEVGLPHFDARSPAARALEAQGLVSFRPAADYHAVLTLNSAVSNNTVDLRPGIPMILRR